MKFFKYVLLTILILNIQLLQGEPSKKICVNMIVKNESKVIKRCLESVKPLVDYWIIVDTGSSDGTQDIIKDCMKDIPGELYERPWINFGHNRNEALNLAKDKADYILFIDADEILSFSDDFVLPELNKDFYYIQTNFNSTCYSRVQLINAELDWEWTGVLHESVNCKDIKTFDTLLGVTNIVKTDGFRSQDPKKFQKDAELLQEAVLKEPTNSRYMFYLAQSYKDAQLYESAIKNYQKRILMGGWDQEVFWSFLQIGILQEELNLQPEIIANSYNVAHAYRPSRLEPLYRLSNFYRRSQNYLDGYQIALKGLATRHSEDILFVEKWIYDYGLMLEFSICAYWIEKYPEALLASYLILAQPNLPDNVRDCVQSNLVWIHAKMKENKSVDYANGNPK